MIGTIRMSGTWDFTQSEMQRSHRVITWALFHPPVLCHACKGAPISSHMFNNRFPGVRPPGCLGRSTCGRVLCISGLLQMAAINVIFISRAGVGLCFFSVMRPGAATYSPPMLPSRDIAHASLVHVDHDRVVVLMHRVQHPLQPTQVHDNLHIPSCCSEYMFGFKHLTTRQCYTSQPRTITWM